MNEDMTDCSESQVYKQRWLLFQLQPSFVHPHVWDVFEDLSCKLSPASDAFINSKTRDLLTSVRNLCFERSTVDATQTPLFCVLDEAQYAASQLQTSFRSDNNGAHRPVLREIVRAWESQASGHGVFMVVAGTGISKDVVDQAMTSAIMKDSRYRWCSDTGAFDHVDIQEAYLRKYLPSEYLASDSGKRLLERLWYWLHGRHRFTTGYVSELLLNGFRQPHSLLNAYILHFSGFKVTDSQEYVKQEQQDNLPVLSHYRLDFSKLKKSNAHYFMRATLPIALGTDEETYVEYGFARFVDSETKTVAVDEPLVLLAATHWINKNHSTNYKYFANRIKVHDQLSNGFENYVAFCIDLAFMKKRPLSDVFSFVGTPPHWANFEAELVALYRTGDGRGPVEESSVRFCASSGPSLTLGVNAKSPEETTAWLDSGCHAALCFPLNSMGPDIMFVLKLSDGSRIWVAVQNKYTSGKNGSMARPVLRQAMRSVTPSFYFIDKGNDTHPRIDAGTCSVLRVITSFPADANIKRCIEEDPDTEGHSIAILNIELLKQLTKKMSPVDLLQTLEERWRLGGKKRKRTGENSGPVQEKPKKKIRLKI
ncbi:hypothetical protein MD484_g1487, partial [Candolleomyces efflorescens]